MVLALIFGVLLIASLWVNFNLYSNLIKFETNYNEIEEAKREDEEFILKLREKVLTYRSQLRQMDNLGAFESDDEVGFFFKELNEMIEEISVYFNIKDDAIRSSLETLPLSSDLSTVLRGRYGEKN